MLYKVLKIDEDIDFGCEERPEGASVMAVVTLQNAEKEERILRMEDDLLYEREINENDLVYLDEKGKLAKALGDDWTKRVGSIDYDISSFVEKIDAISQGKKVVWKCPFCGGNVIITDKNDKAVHIGCDFCDMTIDIGDY